MEKFSTEACGGRGVQCRRSDEVCGFSFSLVKPLVLAQSFFSQGVLVRRGVGDDGRKVALGDGSGTGVSRGG